MDSTAVALASIGVSGLTAIVVPALAARQARKGEAQRFHQERLNRDFDELRILLDEATASIDPYINAVASMESVQSGSNDLKDPKLFETLGPFTDARGRVRGLQARLIVRLGRDSPVIAAFDRAVNVIGNAGIEVATMIALEEPVPDNLRAARPARRLEWYAAYEDFLDAAVQLVGSPAEPITKKE